MRSGVVYGYLFMLTRPLFSPETTTPKSPPAPPLYRVDTASPDIASHPARDECPIEERDALGLFLDGEGVEVGESGEDENPIGGREAEAIDLRMTGPPLSEDPMGRAESVAFDLFEISHARSEFAPLDDERVDNSASMRFRYGLETVEALKTTGEHVRKYFSRDIRKTEHLNFT